MRHGLSENKLGRDWSHRMATVRDIAKATLIHQRICTTKARAKQARKLVDRLITLGKHGTLSARRRAFAILCDHNVVSDLFTKTSPLFKNRNGGYTRIIPLSLRRGDNAHLAYLELTEKTEIVVSKPKSQAATKTKEIKKPVAQPQAQPAKAQPAKEEEKARLEKPKAAPHHSKEDLKSPDKGKGAKNIMGGFKKMFTKKPSDGK